MAESLLTICDHVLDFKKLCNNMAVECGTIQVLTLTDGLPGDSARTQAAAKQAIIEQEELGLAQFHAFVVEGCDALRLNEIFPRPAEVLSIAKIVPFFRSVSRSLRRVSRRNVQCGYDLNVEILRDLGGDRHA